MVFLQKSGEHSGVGGPGRKLKIPRFDLGIEDLAESYDPSKEVFSIVHQIKYRDFFSLPFQIYR